VKSAVGIEDLLLAQRSAQSQTREGEPRTPASGALAYGYALLSAAMIARQKAGGFCSFRFYRYLALLMFSPWGIRALASKCRRL
jgi:hypothetical protein